MSILYVYFITQNKKKSFFFLSFFSDLHTCVCMCAEINSFCISRSECGTWNGMDMMDLGWWVEEDESKLPFPFDIYFMTFHSSTCTLFFRFLFFFRVYYIKHTYFMLNFFFVLPFTISTAAYISFLWASATHYFNKLYFPMHYFFSDGIISYGFHFFSVFFFACLLSVLSNGWMDGGYGGELE